MRLENSFAVPASPERTWALLNDVPRVVPNMPGAELTEIVDATTWKATMHVKLGPIALQFATDVRREVSDERALRTTLAIKARELKGRGGATATIESSLDADGSGTRVTIVTELQMQGAVAQYGRGVVPDVAGQLVDQFAANLAGQLRESDGSAVAGSAEAAGEGQRTAAGGPADPVAVAPIGGLRLILRAIARSLLRLMPGRRAK
ncbi:MAG TPA: SRPBCC family protein [Solirubrobacteraceae bacterium]|nr:SRPBCC family protein [Solirubrobacteraceae bacterium]